MSRSPQIPEIAQQNVDLNLTIRNTCLIFVIISNTNQCDTKSVNKMLMLTVKSNNLLIIFNEPSKSNL